MSIRISIRPPRLRGALPGGFPRAFRGFFPAAALLTAAVLAAGCASTPVEATPRAEAADPGALDLVGVVTVEGDTVRFDRPRADDPTGGVVRAPRIEGDAVVGTTYGRETRVPVDDVAVYLHRESATSRRSRVIAGVAGVAVVAGALVFILAGGL